MRIFFTRACAGDYRLRSEFTHDSFEKPTNGRR